MTINNLKSTFTRVAQSAEIPGNKAAIVRLCLVAVSLVGVLALSLVTLPPISDGLGDVLTGLLSGVVSSMMVAAIVWGFAKWAAFIFPKSYAVASRCWDHLYAWNLIGLAIKAMIWVYLVMMPVALFGIILTPLFYLIYALSYLPSVLLSRAILITVCVGFLFFVILLDVCRLTDRCWKQTLVNLFRKRGNGCGV